MRVSSTRAAAMTILSIPTFVRAGTPTPPGGGPALLSANVGCDSRSVCDAAHICCELAPRVSRLFQGRTSCRSPARADWSARPRPQQALEMPDDALGGVFDQRAQAGDVAGPGGDERGGGGGVERAGRGQAAQGLGRVLMEDGGMGSGLAQLQELGDELDVEHAAAPV